MEWELKIRNQAMKTGCASEQLDGFKRSLFMIRVVVDTIVQTMYIILQIAMALFRLLIPSAGESVVAQISAELSFWFNKLVVIMVEAMNRLADMLFELIFSSGGLGQALKAIVGWMCEIMQVVITIWNYTGRFFGLIDSVFSKLLTQTHTCNMQIHTMHRLSDRQAHGGATSPRLGKNHLADLVLFAHGRLHPRLFLRHHPLPVKHPLRHAAQVRLPYHAEAGRRIRGAASGHSMLGRLLPRD